MNSVDVTSGPNGLGIAKVATATTLNGSSFGFQIFLRLRQRRRNQVDHDDLGRHVLFADAR